MRFILYCGRDARDVGIEDSQGNLDLGKFKDHVRRCRDCRRYLGLLSVEANKLIESAFAKEKGG